MKFKLLSIIYRIVINTINQWQVVIDNVCENSKLFRFDYAVGDLVYVDKNEIYHKLHYQNNGLYRIKELFTNSEVFFQRVKVNGLNNIRRVESHLR